MATAGTPAPLSAKTVIALMSYVPTPTVSFCGSERVTLIAPWSEPAIPTMAANAIPPAQVDVNRVWPMPITS